MKLEIFFLFLSSGLFCVNAGNYTITVDGTDTGRAYEGIGAVSAGANTRLLIDYNEPYRSDILDFLFKPKFGAALQHLKVEIGGGTSSTSGAEPSHAITRAELTNPVSRGYEFWLMKEARDRNPNVILDCLPWAFPYWLEGTFCINCFCCPHQDTADYLTAFLEVASDDWNLELDWIGGASNEKDPHRQGNWTPWLNWVVNNLRPTLNSAGYSSVKIQAPEGSWSHWDIFDQLAVRPDVDDVIEAVGYHYVDQKNAYPSASDIATGKPMWSSEDAVSSGNWSSARDIVRRMNNLYHRGKITKMEIWCPIDSCADGVLWSGVGIMQADTPWSGYYYVRPAVWGIAHYTQFTEVGWKYLDGGCGYLSDLGNYATLKDPDSDNWSTIIYCENSETLDFNLNNVSTGTVHVWKSTSSNQFVQQSYITPVGGSFTINCSADSLYSLTTTTGQQKGQPAHTIPASTEYPFPYSEDFESYDVGVTPKYISDMQGTFEVANCKGGKSGKCLQQMLPEKGDYTWDYTTHEPTATMTLFGEMEWDNYELSSDVYIEEGEVYLAVHKGQTQRDCGYAFVLKKTGQWLLYFDDTQNDDRILDRGMVNPFEPNEWHNIKVRCINDKIDAYVDSLRVCTVIDNRRTSGQPCLGGSYKLNQFDNISVKSAGPVWTMLDDTDSSLTWGSGWTDYFRSDYYGGSCKYTSVAGRYVEFPFTGGAGRVIGNRRYDLGYLDIYVDNVFQTSVDCYSSTTQYQSVLYETNELPLDNHTIRAVVTGLKNPASTNAQIVLDAFSYTDSESISCPEPGTNLSLSATASASSVWYSDPTYAADKANDANYVTRWNTALGEWGDSWLQLDFGQEVTFSRTRFTQFWDRISSYKIQYYDGTWKDAYVGTTTSYTQEDVFSPVTGTKARLYVVEALNCPSIFEFEVYIGAGKADLDGNGVVNLNDLKLLCDEWLNDECGSCCDCDGADLYHDGKVNLQDYSITAGDYKP